MRGATRQETKGDPSARLRFIQIAALHGLCPSIAARVLGYTSKSAAQMTSKPTAPTAPLVDLTSRRIIVLSFWAILLLGLPFWWYTTTIERLTLPKGQVEAWKSQEVSYSSGCSAFKG